MVSEGEVAAWRSSGRAQVDWGRVGSGFSEGVVAAWRRGGRAQVDWWGEGSGRRFGSQIIAGGSLRRLAFVAAAVLEGAAGLEELALLFWWGRVLRLGPRTSTKKKRSGVVVVLLS